MKVAVIGSGYVGLVLGACLAESGNDVIGADIVDASERADATAAGSAPRCGPSAPAGLGDEVQPTASSPSTWPTSRPTSTRST